MIAYRISDEVLKKVSHGDGAKIASQLNVNRNNVNRALRAKRATLEIYTAIINYYKNN